ncbi:unnamed protein product [Trichobilharzia szidati]|nr:unnamed protein product [Trichobilharzia szidati]
MLNPDESKLRLRRLNTDVHNPCYLLHIHDVNLLLDCCLDLSNLSYFLPNHQLMSPGCSDLPEMCGTLGNSDTKEVRGENDGAEGEEEDDSGVFTKLGGMNYMTTGFKFCMLKSSEMSSIFWETIDVILISNTRSILGLPFLFENTKFRGKIFTTEPVVKFGKILIDDLLNELEQLSESQVELNSSKKKKKTKINEFNDATDYLVNSGDYNWTKFYTRESVTKALNRVHLIAYHEPVDLFGLLTIKGLSAGYAIGSCNWIITSSSEKVAYISHTSLLYSHVLPFDDSEFGDTDILIVGTVNMYASNQLEKTVEEFRHIVVQTLARGGNVLVPTNPCGVIFDLLETALHAKENFNGNILPLFPHDHQTVVNNKCTNNGTANIQSTTTTTTGTGTSTATTLGNGQSSHHKTVTSASSEIDLSVSYRNNSSNNNTNNANSCSSTITTQTPISCTGGSSSSSRVARSPVFFLSNQVHISLAYSNAYGEWLNAVKESVLYTADCPFPFQSLLQSGQLVALKSLYDSSSSKKLLSDSSSTAYSSHMLTSPLLLGSGNSSSTSGNYFEQSALNSSTTGGTTTSSSTILALTSSSVRDSTMANSNSNNSSSSSNNVVSGGIWPNSPCLIFASHPSLRIGPAVHLMRALAYGGLRLGSRTATTTSTPSHHSIILIESGDYVPAFEWNSKTLCTPETHLRRIITPFLQPDKLSTNCTKVSQLSNNSGCGTPVLSISDTATVYWLPMEARIGANQVDQLIKRCGEPRLALILPQEVYDQPGNWMSNIPTSEQFKTKLHGIAYGQHLCLNLPDKCLQQVRVSSKLVSKIKPVYITTTLKDTEKSEKSVSASGSISSSSYADKVNDSNNNNSKMKIKSSQQAGESDQLSGASSGSGAVGVVGKSELKRKLSDTTTPSSVVPTSVTTTTSSDTSTTPATISDDKDSGGGEDSQNKRTCIALVDGLLTTRDGKHWLVSKEEKLEPDIIHPVKKDFIRPSTPPPPPSALSTSLASTNSSSNQVKNRNIKSNFNTKLDSDNRVLVSFNGSSANGDNQSSTRINPYELIQKLTERGVTGAYLADPCTARQVYARFAVYNMKSSESIDNVDVILFPNPNTMICLSDYGSHIIAMDESTRTTIRDTLLLFLQYLESHSTNSTEL